MAYSEKSVFYVNASNLENMHGIKYCLRTEGRQRIHRVRSDGSWVFSGKNKRLVFAYKGEHLLL